MSRKVIDCRDFPSERGCTLTISGEEHEVLRAAVQHGFDGHGHADTPKFREQLASMLRDEAAVPA